MARSAYGMVAVVTGASSGIGEAIALRLARGGMTVVAAARREDRLKALAARQDRIVAVPTDVGRRTDVAALADFVARELGRCDVLVNNAGIRGKNFDGPDDLDDVVRTMQINFMGVANCMALFRDLLVSSAPSHVINVASISGKVGVGAAPYIASKFAVVGFSEALTLSWANDGITVTQLNPGHIATEAYPKRRLMQSRFGQLLVGQPADVADAVVDVLVRRQRERTVPRWYRAAVVVRHVAPALFWSAASRTRRARGIRD